MTVESTSLAADRRETFVLQEIQPDLLGLMDGSVSIHEVRRRITGPDANQS
jgi:hypothetical protein